MSDPVDPVQAGQTPASPVTEAAQAATSPARQATDGDIAANVSFNNMTELQMKAPKVYKAMVENIALGMLSDINHHLQALKQIRQESERNNEK